MGDDQPTSARAAVAATNPSSVEEATRLLTIMSQHLAWLFRRGLPVDNADVVFHPDEIDQFVVDGCAHLSEGTRSNYRSALRVVAASVLGPAAYPRPVPLQTSDAESPYSVVEQAELISWAEGLSTARMRFGATVLLALGLGAGLATADMCVITGRDVKLHPGGPTIEVRTHAPRSVPVCHRWATEVRSIASGARDQRLVLPQREVLTAKAISGFVERLPRGSAPKLSTRRLRITWIVDRLNDGVPLNLLSVAAGVDPDALSVYVGFMRTVPADLADRLLRGGESN